MKVVHLSTYDGSIGGADTSAFRVHRCLVDAGIDSTLLVQHKQKADPTIVAAASNTVQLIDNRLRPVLDALPLLRYPKWNRKAFWQQRVPNPWLKKMLQEIRPDVVNVHLITRGYAPITLFSELELPIVWTLHGMWAFTGGCHYSGSCENYLQDCGACPKLGSRNVHDLSYKTLQKKKDLWKNADISVVGASNWLADCARQSALFRDARVDVIHYPMDINKFKPQDKAISRNTLGLSADKKILLFGARDIGDQRKGFHFVQQALSAMSAEAKASLELVVFGGGAPQHDMDLGVNVVYLGHIQDAQKMITLMSAADVFAAPSIEDNLPNIVVEATCCGTPSISFAVGGLPDIIEHQRNGYLAKPYDVSDLRNGIEWLMQNDTLIREQSEYAREKALRDFASHSIAEKYRQLYSDLLN